MPFRFTFSQSSLQDYSDCPRRFQLRYIDHLNWPGIESEPVTENERRQQEGQDFHRLLQQQLLGIGPEKLAHSVNTPNLERWWHNYLTSDLDISGYAQHTELTLACPVADHRLIAKYDLIAIQPGEKALILDWKTSARRPRDEWLAARWQTRVYRSLLVRAGSFLNNGSPIPAEQIEMIYWFAEFPSEPARFKYDDQQFKRDGSALEKLITEISSNTEFPMTEDEKLCRYCIYRSYCGRGKQAGDVNEADSGDETNPEFDINFEQIGEIEF